MVRFAGVVLVWLVTQISAATAQDIPLWGHKIIGQIYAAQFNDGCFASPLETPSVYLLGVIPSDKLLDEQARVELVARLENILSSQGSIQFRSAGAFQPIASSAGSTGEAKRAEISKLVEGASDADLTVLLRPYAKRGPKVDIRVMFWARDGKGSARKLTCTPAINIAYKTGTADATCTNAWKQAQRANTIVKYQGFIDYLGHCPQADLAQKNMDGLKAKSKAASSKKRCQVALAAARKIDTSQAYQDYLEANASCPNADMVYAIIDTIRQREKQQSASTTCRSAYDVARSTNTSAAYSAFLATNGACPQSEAAATLRDALTAQDNARKAVEEAERKAARRTNSSGENSGGTTTRPVPSGGLSCGQLWYQRNQIFHRNGYCFSTARGKRNFSNEGCFTKNPRLSASEKRTVNNIKRLERQNGC